MMNGVRGWIGCTRRQGYARQTASSYLDFIGNHSGIEERTVSFSHTCFRIWINLCICSFLLFFRFPGEEQYVSYLKKENIAKYNEDSYCFSESITIYLNYWVLPLKYLL